jgi:uncharacterized protein with HEPN domain
MRVEERDLSFLWDMRQAAKEIIEFMIDASLDKFSQNKQLRYAVERQLMVIGEAAAHVSIEFQERHSEILWRQIVGQRNVLAHEYGEILVERIWLTATTSIPLLLNQIEKLLPEENERD